MYLLFLKACYKDNIVTFMLRGTGTADEGATKCNPGDPQTAAFTWSFQTSETVLFVSTRLIHRRKQYVHYCKPDRNRISSIAKYYYTRVLSQNAVITFIH